MNVNAHQKGNKPIKISFNGLIILFGIAWAVIEFFWRLPFTRGNVGGIYWFFYFFEKLSSPLTTLGFVTTLFFLVIVIVIHVIKKGSHSNIAKTVGALFLATSIIGIATFKPIQPDETQHLDALETHGRLYYLTAYSALDTNYALYRCDSKGIFCKQVYLSNDFMPLSFNAKLVYYPTSDEIAIDVKDEGEIYRHKLP